MRDDWIFDVLADLRIFALRNDLPALAAQLDVTQQVARDELAWRGGGQAAKVRDSAGHDKELPN